MASLAARLALTAALVAVPTFVVATGAGGRTQEQTTGAAQLYGSDCAYCHGPRGEGSPRGPSLVGVGGASVDYMLTTGRMPLPLDEDQPERSEPAYEPETIDALVAYVEGFGPGGVPVPSVDLSDADVASGGEHYRLNCAACHHATGAGGALPDREAPHLGEATAVQVVEAARVGPGQMPAFGESALTDAQLTDVAAYVTEVLRNPDDRGGQPIWHLGPVPEGAVAIVGGLGILILFAVWVEGRSKVDGDGA